MISIRPLISKFLGIVSSVQIIIGITDILCAIV